MSFAVNNYNYVLLYISGSKGLIYKLQVYTGLPVCGIE